MPRRLSSVAAITVALVVGAGLSIVGCAVSDPPDLTPDVAPGLPGVDASYEASPAMGGGNGDAGGSSEASTDAADAGKEDAAAFVATDSGGDAPPPPPPPPPAGPPKPAQGEVLITEVMYNPFGPEPKAEWFEVYNTATGPRSLGGLSIADGGGRTHVIAAGTVIPAGEYLLFVRDSATALTQKVPSAAIFYEYGTGLPDNAGVLLLNGTNGSVSLHDGSTQVAQAPYGPWFSQSGGSTVQLKILDYAESASQSSWCLSLNAWTTGSDKGTPGAASDCP